MGEKEVQGEWISIREDLDRWRYGKGTRSDWNRQSREDVVVPDPESLHKVR